MNKLATTLITTLVLVATGTAIAQDFYGQPGRHHRSGGGKGMQGVPMVEQMMRGIKRLDLSTEQEVNIRNLMQNLKAEIRPGMEEARAGHLQLRELIKAETLDEAAVADLAKKEADMAAERLLIASRTLSKVYAQLTEQQRIELDFMFQQRMARRAERFNQRQGQS